MLIRSRGIDERGYPSKYMGVVDSLIKSLSGAASKPHRSKYIELLMLDFLRIKWDNSVISALVRRFKK
jgi:hypothetical protein